MEHNLAVLIDFENIVTGAEKEGLGRFDITLVFRRLKDKGRIIAARAYGDWGRYARFKTLLVEQGISMMELTSHGKQEKNRADIALVVDAMELAFTRPHLDTYVILSGDSDFTPLVLRLKELNKRVIGCGTRRSTSSLIVGACDEFIFYDNLVRPVPTTRPARPEPPARPETAPRVDPAARPLPAAAAEAEPEGGLDEEEPTRELGLEEAMDLLVECLEGVQADDPTPVAAGVLKNAMLRKEPTFNERDLNFPNFGRFLREAQKGGRVSLVKDVRSGSFLVDVPNRGTAEDPTPPTGEADPIVSETSPTVSRGDAFLLLRRTLTEMQTEEPGPLGASLVRLAMKQSNPSFDEHHLGYGGFGSFLEAAHEAGQIRLERLGSSGAYVVDVPLSTPIASHPATSAPPPQGERLASLQEESFALLVRILSAPPFENARAVHASLLKPALIKAQPSFSERSVGFGSFGRFLEEAAQRGYVRISAGRKAGGYFVSLTPNTARPVPAEAPTSAPEGDEER